MSCDVTSAADFCPPDVSTGGEMVVVGGHR
jgi:hypothetical protein